MKDSSFRVSQCPSFKISYLTPYVLMGLMQMTQTSHPLTGKEENTLMHNQGEVHVAYGN